MEAYTKPQDQIRFIDLRFDTCMLTTCSLITLLTILRSAMRVLPMVCPKEM